MSDWRPGAPLSVQRQRATLLAELRQYFHRLGVMEVETPLLCQYGVTDPGLDNYVVVCGDGERWLQTSPEYAMKRLLAAGSGDIFQICKAFRSGELGQRHNPEYTLLEWYRLGLDHYDLLHQVGELVCGLLGRAGWQVWPWRTLVQHVLGSDIERATLRELEQLALAQVGDIPPALDREALLDLLVSHCVEPALATWGVVFVVDYPLPQAALARRVQGPDGEAMGLFESGAILIYLAEKTGSELFPSAGLAHVRTLEWLMWQMGNVGPMFGQAHHFPFRPKEDVPYG